MSNKYTGDNGVSCIITKITVDMAKAAIFVEYEKSIPPKTFMAQN